MPLPRSERETFLAEPHTAAVSIAAGTDRAPVSVPVWYDYAPGAEPWFHTTADSVKAGLLHAAGRCTLLVQTTAPRVRYVSVSGPVRIAEATREDLEHMARRYLAAEAVDGFLAEQATWGPQITVTLTPRHWLAADLTL